MPIEPKSFLWSADPETGVATLILNRPERLNALTFEVYGELLHTFLALPEETDVRAVVITGQGKAFCSGGDVRDIIGPLLEADFDRLHDFTRMTCDLIGAIRRCGKPVIAALNGTVAGRGSSHRHRVRHPYRGDLGAYRVPVHQGRAIRRRYGRCLAAAAPRGTGSRHGVTHDGQLHRRRRGSPNWSLQPGRRRRARA